MSATLAPAAPARPDRRLEDRLAAQAAGKAIRIVVRGNCKVCHRRSADVPATKSQALAYAAAKYGKGDIEALTGFTRYQMRMLTTGVHRKCQSVEDQKIKDKAAKKALAARNREARGARRPVVLEEGKVERAIARRAAKRRA